AERAQERAFEVISRIGRQRARRAQGRARAPSRADRYSRPGPISPGAPAARRPPRPKSLAAWAGGPPALPKRLASRRRALAPVDLALHLVAVPADHALDALAQRGARLPAEDAADLVDVGVRGLLVAGARGEKLYRKLRAHDLLHG